jgi:peptide/nickel transport system substrate-binding protein
VGALRSEPPTFNRYTGNAYPTHLISLLTQAPLVRINRTTQQLEPWLADRWTRSQDGLRYQLHLREHVTFSDGYPFTADDVVFSFAALYDSRTASLLAGALRIGGKPLAVKALGPHEIEIRFPGPYGPGLRILDALPIYPRHRLQSALDRGVFAAAWGPATPVADMAGLGPFELARYDPGQRLVFVRNPHYWRRDGSGRPLPYLDRLTLELVPDQNAELLRLRAGEIDLMQDELRPEDYRPLRSDADAGRVRLVDVGPSLDVHVLWFNLGPRPGDGRGWLRRDEFRQAIASAVDRQQFSRIVYLGAAEPAWSLISQANREWVDSSVPAPSFDPARARQLLARVGLRDTNGDGRLEDNAGRPAAFTLLVQKGVSASEKGPPSCASHWLASASP